MEALQSMAWLASAKPKLYSSMLQLLCVLASDEATGPATLYLLRQQEVFLSQLDRIACCPLPSEVGPLFKAHREGHAYLTQVLCSDKAYRFAARYRRETVTVIKKF